MIVCIYTLTVVMATTDINIICTWSATIASTICEKDDVSIAMLATEAGRVYHEP